MRSTAQCHQVASLAHIQVPVANDFPFVSRQDRSACQRHETRISLILAAVVAQRPAAGRPRGCSCDCSGSPRGCTSGWSRTYLRPAHGGAVPVAAGCRSAVRPKDPAMLWWARDLPTVRAPVAGKRPCGSGCCHADCAMPTDEILGSGRCNPPRTDPRPYLPLCARPVHTASCNYTYACR
jgi:hypothetical protein